MLKRATYWELVVLLAKSWGQVMSGPAQVWLSIVVAAFILGFGVIFAIKDSVQGILITGLVAIGALHLSSFVIWARERDECVSVQERLQDKRNRQRICELLAIKMMAGRNFMAQCTNSEDKGSVSGDAVSGWLEETRTLIRKELGPLEFALFDTPDNAPPQNVITSENPNHKFLNTTWNGLRFRVNNLKKLIEDNKT